MDKEETEQTPAAEAETDTQKPVEEPPPSQPADRLAELEQTISQGFEDRPGARDSAGADRRALAFT
jgi:hypothetical protein